MTQIRGSFVRRPANALSLICLHTCGNIVACLVAVAASTSAAACSHANDRRPIAELGSSLTVWSDSHKLFASDGAELDEFGLSVALSPDRALIGAYGENAFQGAAYVFALRDGTWLEEQKLVARDGVAGDDFGRSVALTERSALVGASGADDYQGAVFVFAREGNIWSEQQKLAASDAAYLDQLGWSIAATPARALVGAYGKEAARGAAYVFSYDGGTWVEQQKLLASDGAADDRLGYAVALHGDVAVVGAPGEDEYRGAAYVFAFDGNMWLKQQKLIAGDVQDFSQFGAAVAVSGDRALIGAAWVDDYLGAAYLFVRQDGVWTQAQKLVATQGVNGERLGNAVVLDAGRALIGAMGSQQNRGLAYVFEEQGGAWYERQKLSATDGVEFDLFGTSLALVNNVALVGANYTDQLRGAAYTFTLGNANGYACTSHSECASGFCVDDRCCDADCEGECGACAIATGATADGTCTLAPRGSSGNPTCGAGVCTGRSAQCAACESDADCGAESYCTAAGTCARRKELGASCDPRATYDCSTHGCQVCQSGICVDGVCCDTACGELCAACTAALKGTGIDGVCEPIAAGRDPHNECLDDGAQRCGDNGLCDGTLHCQRYAVSNCKPEACSSGSECASGHCEDQICCDRACGPNERCRAELKVAGTDGVCGFEIAAENGAACQFDVQCSSGICLNGVCRMNDNDEATSTRGCGCRTQARSPNSFDAWLGFIAAVSVSYRRRRKF